MGYYCRIDSYDKMPKGHDVIKLLVLTNNVEHVHDNLRLIFNSTNNKKQVHLVKGAFFVEILHPEVNKGRGLLELCKHLDMSVEEVVAFGDGNNDYEFLENAGLGIAMANAEASAKKAADYVSEFTNDQNAVSKELLSLLQDKK